MQKQGLCRCSGTQMRQLQLDTRPLFVICDAPCTSPCHPVTPPHPEDPPLWLSEVSSQRMGLQLPDVLLCAWEVKLQDFCPRMTWLWCVPASAAGWGRQRSSTRRHHSAP
uniref:Uncharacterized protein n=1 Tax=Anser brachyrhynchus TaxID=132585 RepID=A0A8B9B7T4_9AVES